MVATADKASRGLSKSMTMSLVTAKRSNLDPTAETPNQGVVGAKEANETTTGSSPFYQDGGAGHDFGSMAQATGEPGHGMYGSLFRAAAQGLKQLHTFVSRVDHVLYPAMAEPDLARMAAGGMESLGGIGNQWFFDSRDPEANDTRGDDGGRAEPDPMNPINLLPKMSKVDVLPNINKMEACFHCNGDAADDSSIVTSDINESVVEETLTSPTLLTSRTASLLKEAPALLTSRTASLVEKPPPQEDPILMNRSQSLPKGRSQTRSRSRSKSRGQSKTRGRGKSRTRSKSRDRGRSHGRGKSSDREQARERSKSRIRSASKHPKKDTTSTRTPEDKLKAKQEKKNPLTTSEVKKVRKSGNRIDKKKDGMITHDTSSNSREERKAKLAKQKGGKTSKSSSTANKSKLKTAAGHDGKRPPSPANTKESSSKKSQTKEDREESSKEMSGKVGSAFGAVFRRVATGNKASNGKNEADAKLGAKRGQASQSKKVTRGAPAGKSAEHKPPRTAKYVAANVDKKSMGRTSPTSKDVTRHQFKGGVKGRKQKKLESKSKKGRNYEDAEVRDEGSWLEDLVGHWQHSKEDQPSMADLEDQRLGELDDRPTRIGTTKRLEAAFDPTQDDAYFEPASTFGLGTLTNSVSFDLSEQDTDPEDTAAAATAAADALDIISDDTDTLWTDTMTTEYGSKGGTAGNRAWMEIVKAADILSRYYFSGNQEEEESSLDEQTYTEVRSALSTFKDHAIRLKVKERELFAADRDDPSVLGSTGTFDDDGGMSAIWSQIGRPLDKYIDSYVDAFESVFKRNMKDPSPRNKASRLGSDRVSAKSVANE
jgi:hypothetical protein